MELRRSIIHASKSPRPQRFYFAAVTLKSKELDSFPFEFTTLIVTTPGFSYSALGISAVSHPELPNAVGSFFPLAVITAWGSKPFPLAAKADPPSGCVLNAVFSMVSRGVTTSRYGA